MDQELYMTTLRVLAKWAAGERLDPQQVHEVRRHARPDEAGLPLDELCCLVIHRVVSREEPCESRPDDG